MKNKLIYVFAILFSLKLSYTQQKTDFGLNLVFPSQNTQLELTGKPFFLIGTISPAGASLKINGAKAQVDDDGAFVCYADIALFERNDSTKGKFLFNISTASGSKEIEKVYSVKPLPQTSPSTKLVVDETWPVQPSVDLLLKPHSPVKVEVKATPGSKAYFNVSGIKRDFPMPKKEIVNRYIWGDAVFGEGFKGINDTVKGIYAGSFYLPEGLKNAEVTVTVVNKKLGKKSVKASGKITSLDGQIPLVIKTNYDPNLIIGRYEPAGGYKLFLDKDIPLLADGKIGAWYKCKLTPNQHMFVSSYSVTEMPEGTPPPRPSIYMVRCEDSLRYVNIKLGLSEKCPYKIVEGSDPTKLKLLVYNVTSNIDWIYYDKKDDFVKEIRWDQPEDGVLTLDIRLNEKAYWGYYTKFEDNTLVLTIKKPAKRNSGFLFWDNQLKGRVISLDPGHNPESGAIGPRGTRERDVNLKITLQLKKMLEDAGAEVHLTHTTGPLPLRQRKARVNSFNPEISVSIHNNAVPEGVDPIKHNGSSVYYYYPQSLPLAKLLHKNIVKDLKLKDFCLYWDNLYMSRIPESISLLIEPAFMIIPEQERLLNTEEFREKIARSIYNSIEEFYEEYAQ